MGIENLLAAFEIWGILICSGIGIYFFLVTKINKLAMSYFRRGCYMLAVVNVEVFINDTKI